MSFLFHSPTQVPFLAPVIQTWDERFGCAVRGVADTLTGAAWRVCDGGKTTSGGMFSPRVRVSFAMRLRRTSAAEGAAGRSEKVGDMGREVWMGESGTRVSVGATGTALIRSMRGRGVSPDRRPFVDGFGVGRTSMLGRDSIDVKDTREELEDDETEYIDSFEDAVSGKRVNMDPCRREAFVDWFRGSCA